MLERKGSDVVVVMVALTSCRSVIFYRFNDIGFFGGKVDSRLASEEAKRKHQRNRNKNGKLFLRGSGSQVFFFKRLFEAKSEILLIIPSRTCR